MEQFKFGKYNVEDKILSLQNSCIIKEIDMHSSGPRMCYVFVDKNKIGKPSWVLSVCFDGIKTGDGIMPTYTTGMLYRMLPKTIVRKKRIYMLSIYLVRDIYFIKYKSPDGFKLLGYANKTVDDAICGIIYKLKKIQIC